MTLQPIDIDSIIQAVVIALVPVLLELLTGIGRAFTEWLKSKLHQVWSDRFIADVQSIGLSLKQKFVDEWKRASADGKITAEERQKLRDIFDSEVSKILKMYPSMMVGYLKDMANHWLDEWIAAQKANPSLPVGEPSESLSPEESSLANTEASQ